MFPNTITLGTVTLTKIREQDYSSEYLFRNDTISWSMKIRHSRTKETATKKSQDRHNVEFTYTIFATSTFEEFTSKVYVVWDFRPNRGNTDSAALTAMLNAFIDNPANITSLVGWES